MRLPVSLRAGGILALFVGIGLAAVALIHEQTREQIATAERQVVLDRLAAVLPDGHDNAPEDQVYERPNPLDHATPLRIYPAYAEDTYLGAAVEVETPEGYAGTIRLLVGIDADGEIIGVRTVAHRETPGLGDAIETARSDWIHGFDNRALGEPPEADWRVRQDGGAFDGITGATITARAVIDAVRAVLIDHAAEPEAYRGEAQAEDATAIDPEADDRSDEGPTG